VGGGASCSSSSHDTETPSRLWNAGCRRPHAAPSGAHCAAQPTAPPGSHDSRDITARLNEIYVREPSTLDPGLAAMQRASLPHEAW